MADTDLRAAVRATVTVTLSRALAAHFAEAAGMDCSCHGECSWCREIAATLRAALDAPADPRDAVALPLTTREAEVLLYSIDVLGPIDVDWSITLESIGRKLLARGVRIVRVDPDPPDPRDAVVAAARDYVAARAATCTAAIRGPDEAHGSALSAEMRALGDLAAAIRALPAVEVKP